MPGRVAPDEEAATKARILEKVSEVRILDPGLSREWIRQRQERGIDRYDEVWEGVYVVPALPSNPHQDLVLALSVILHGVIVTEGRGRVQAGANVSDRRSGWDHNFRGPDVVVVLKSGRAIDCTTHWFGGPDFLTEIQSPGDDTDEKIPFYSKIQVRELLIIHRDTRQLRLYRHDGQQLVPVEPSAWAGGKWLVSEVVPLAFRRRVVRGQPKTEVRRTDGTPGNWIV
jgi:hypothetical protein